MKITTMIQSFLYSQNPEQIPDGFMGSAFVTTTLVNTIDPEIDPNAIDEDKAFLPPPEEVAAVSCLIPMQEKVLFYKKQVNSQTTGYAICCKVFSGSTLLSSPG